MYLEKVKELAQNNKYTRWYSSIVEAALARATTKKRSVELLGYSEKHHILPKSFNMGGEKDKLNYVYLSACEHLVCHILLAKMFLGTLKNKMGYALFSMQRIQERNRRIKLNSWQYAAIKKAFSEARKNSPGPRTGSHPIPWNKGVKTGVTAWNKGILNWQTDDQKDKQRKSLQKYRSENSEKAKKQMIDALHKGAEKRMLAIQKKTQVDGVVYPSATIAAKEIGLKKTTLIKRVLSKNFPAYCYVENV